MNNNLVIENELIKTKIQNIDIFKIISFFLENESNEFKDSVLIKTLKEYDPNNIFKTIKVHNSTNMYHTPEINECSIVLEDNIKKASKYQNQFKIRYDNNKEKSISIELSVSNLNETVKMHNSINIIYTKENEIKELQLFLDIFKYTKKRKYGYNESFLVYRYDYNFLDKKILEDIENVNDNIYSDIGKEIIAKRNISSDFFDLFALKYDFQDNDLKDFIINVFNERKIIEKTLILIDVVDKKNKCSKEIKQGKKHKL